jgi:ubiquitin-activating enzyme E1
MKNSNSFEGCIALARTQFNDYFDYTIRDLLSLFPEDHVDKDGVKFWSGPKRAPSPISYDASNDLHANFVMSYANLIAASLNIP